MARFRFPLEGLRQLRKSTRTERRMRLAEAYQAQAILTQQQEDLRKELAACRDAQRTLIAAGGLDASQAVQHGRFQLAIESRQATLAEQAATLEGEIERRRLALAEADQQVRLLDKLEQRRRKEFDDRQQSLETKQLDEIATRIPRRNT